MCALYDRSRAALPELIRALTPVADLLDATA
jgi:hypothetical protein